MASIIQILSQKYKQFIENQQKQIANSDQGAVTLIRLQKLAQTFVSLIIQLCCSDDKICHISDIRIKQKANRLLQVAGSARKINFNTMKRIIGKYIDDEFCKNTLFNGLKNEFQLMFVQEEEVSYWISAQNSIFSEQDQQSYSDFLNSLEKSLNQSVFFIKDYQQKLQYQKTFQIWKNDPYQMKIMTYLTQINAPQTQLLILCQQMKWKYIFSEKKIEEKFQIIAEVNFSYKNIQKILKQSYLAKQKKLGRIVSSFKILRIIYLSFPEIWDRRASKPLITEKNPRNPIKFLEPKILDQKIQLILDQIQAENQHQKNEKAEYLINVNSFKMEINMLNQQKIGTFTFKIIEKVQIPNPDPFWKVKGELTIKSQQIQRSFTAVDQNPISKVAQQNIAKRLVTQFYNEYEQIFQRMITIKSKKSIKHDIY